MRGEGDDAYLFGVCYEQQGAVAVDRHADGDSQHRLRRRAAVARGPVLASPGDGCYFGSGHVHAPDYAVVPVSNVEVISGRCHTDGVLELGRRARAVSVPCSARPRGRCHAVVDGHAKGIICIWRQLAYLVAAAVCHVQRGRRRQGHTHRRVECRLGAHAISGAWQPRAAGSRLKYCFVSPHVHAYCHHEVAGNVG